MPPPLLGPRSRPLSNDIFEICTSSSFPLPPPGRRGTDEPRGTPATSGLREEERERGRERESGWAGGRTATDRDAARYRSRACTCSLTRESVEFLDWSGPTCVRRDDGCKARPFYAAVTTPSPFIPSFVCSAAAFTERAFRRAFRSQELRIQPAAAFTGEGIRN